VVFLGHQGMCTLFMGDADTAHGACHTENRLFHAALECVVIKALLFKPPFILEVLIPVCGRIEN
jgi:hypothetical protein